MSRSYDTDRRDLVALEGKVTAYHHGDAAEPASTARHLTDDRPLVTAHVIALDRVVVPATSSDVIALDRVVVHATLREATS